MSVDIALDHLKLKQLQDALLAAFASRGQFEQMLFFATGHLLAHLVTESADLRETVFRVIIEAQSKNWIEQLVQGAHKQNPTQPLLRQFVAEVFPMSLIGLTTDDQANGDPFAAHYLGAGRMFINRRQLREGLRDLTQLGAGISPRIMTISSDLSRCGKTYSHEFIRFVALKRQETLNRPESVAYIDLREEISLGSGLHEFVAQLGRKLRADLTSIPQQEAQTARWARNLATWLLDQINRTGQFWWLVFDSIDQVEGLPQDIHDFIIRLARQVEEEFDPSCRLILISYQSEHLPLDLRQRIVEEVIGKELLPDQMQAFFAMHIQQLLGASDDDPEVRATTDTICDTVMNKLSAFPEESRPFVISRLIEEVLKELAASVHDGG